MGLLKVTPSSLDLCLVFKFTKRINQIYKCSYINKKPQHWSLLVQQIIPETKNSWNDVRPIWMITCDWHRAPTIVCSRSTSLSKFFECWVQRPLTDDNSITSQVLIDLKKWLEMKFENSKTLKYRKGLLVFVFRYLQENVAYLLSSNAQMVILNEALIRQSARHE